MDKHDQSDTSKEGLESKPPTLDDIKRLCSELNAHEVKYLIIGGIAMLQQGFNRATEDIGHLGSLFGKPLRSLNGLKSKACECHSLRLNSS